MTPHDGQHETDALDAATARRLARLARRPIDAGPLAARLEQAMNAAPAQRPASAVRPVRPSHWLGRTLALAAGLLLAAGVTFVAMQSGRHATAAVLDLSDLHIALVSGDIPLTPVRTIDAANRVIAAQLGGGPALPRPLEGVRVQSCCLANVRGALRAVAVLESQDGPPVTLVVAEAPHFGDEMGRAIEIDGRRFFAHQVGGLPMMMSHRGDRWLCVMGRVDDQSLAAIAAAVMY